jgi:hypothetical protein
MNGFCRHNAIDLRRKNIVIFCWVLKIQHIFFLKKRSINVGHSCENIVQHTTYAGRSSMCNVDHSSNVVLRASSGVVVANWPRIVVVAIV